jgi:cytochrome c biogenesis protein CcmG/thiol:disulfide interchange protein DsbE
MGNKSPFSRSSLTLVAFILLFVVLKGPVFFANLKVEGTKIETPAALKLVNGSLAKPLSPYVFVFWATWCGPCELELSRINQLIHDRDIDAQRVFAISVDEDPEAVRKAVQERGYLFPIVWDESGELRTRFKVSGTPTLVLVNEREEVEWVSTGLSPTLDFRLKKHLKMRK